MANTLLIIGTVMAGSWLAIELYSLVVTIMAIKRRRDCERMDDY